MQTLQAWEDDKEDNRWRQRDQVQNSCVASWGCYF